MTFASWLGQMVGRAIGAFGKKKVRELEAKLEGKAKAKVIDITKKVGLLLFAFSLTGATCAREFGVGVAVGVAGCVADPACGAATPTPEPTPTPTPVAH